MSNPRESQSSKQSAVDKNENVGTLTQRRKPIPVRSPVWKHFTKTGKKSRCKYCSGELSGNPKIGTNHLKNHLKLMHNIDLSSQDESGNNSVDQETSRKAIKNSVDLGISQEIINNSFNPDTSQKLLQELVTNGYLPFHTLEEPLFQSWVHSLQPMCTHLNLVEAQRNTMCYFHDERIKLQLELKKLVTINLACHPWRSRRFEYISFTVHFINDDFKLIKRMIGFKQLPLEYHKRHYYIHLKSAVAKFVNDLGVDEKLFNCTLGDCMRETISDTLQESCEINFIECCSELFETLPYHCLSIIRDEIESIRRVIMLNSPAWGEGISLQKQIPIDSGGAGWDSTYHMLREAYNKRAELDQYANQCLAKEYPDLHFPSGDDWRRVGSVVNYMKTFYDAMEAFSKPNTTANLYLVKLWEIRDALYNESLASDEKLKSLSGKLKGGFERHIYEGSFFEEQNNWLPSVLDPRRNKEFLKMCCLDLFGEEIGPSKFEKDLKELNQLYEIYVKVTKNYVIVNSEEFGSCSNTAHQPSFERRFSELKKQKLNQNTTSELERYLSEPVLDADENFDVLNWWKSNENRYPVLSRMARDLLSIPVLACPPESAFYINQEIIDYVDDSNLDPEMLEALMCCKQWNQTAPNNDTSLGASSVITPSIAD